MYVGANTITIIVIRIKQCKINQNKNIVQAAIFVQIENGVLFIKKSHVKV